MSERLLLAGPWVGEFGWELMAFQGRLRVLSTHFDRTFVLTKESSRPLYDDFAETLPLVLDGSFGESDGCSLRFESPEARERFEGCVNSILDIEQRKLASLYPGCRITLYTPSRGQQYPPIPTFPPYQRFRSLAIRGEERVGLYILLVRRNRNLAPERNLGNEWWSCLRELLEKKGYSVEYFVENLEQGLRQLSSADLAVGVSTGGMHLASLCGCPHYVLADDGKWGSWPWAATLKDRYNFIWNPLATPVQCDMSSGRPWSVSVVAERVEEVLRSIGRYTGDRATVNEWRRAVWLPGRMRLYVAHFAGLFGQLFGLRVRRKLLRLTDPNP